MKKMKYNTNRLVIKTFEKTQDQDLGYQVSRPRPW